MKKTNVTAMMSLIVLALIHVAASVTDLKSIDVNGLAFVKTLIMNDMFIIYCVTLLIFISSVALSIYNIFKEL